MPRLKLWHMLPIAIGLHSLLLWVPVQPAANVPVEKPKEIPPSVKVATLPQPAVMPSPSVSPVAPVVRPQPVVTQPAPQPRTVQPQPQIIEQRIIERIVETPDPPGKPAPTVEKPAPIGKAKQQAPVKPKSEPVNPVEPPTPLPKFNTTVDVLTNALGGQSCGADCIKTAATSMDVVAQLTARFGSEPKPILDADGYKLGYTVINREGKREHFLLSHEADKINGISVEISRYQKITDPNILAQMGIS